MKEGEQQASCLVAKQAVEFPQVYTSKYYYPLIGMINIDAVYFFVYKYCEYVQ